MIREYVKTDQSFGAMKFTMQGGEHGDFAHAFPEQMPSTHYLHYEWSANERGMPVLTVEPRLKAEIKPASPEDELIQRLSAMNDGDLATFAAENNVELPPGKKTKAKVVSLIVEALKASPAAK